MCQFDAQVLAHFAEAVRPAVRPLPDAAAQELAFLVARRRQLVDMRVAEQNRSRSAPTRIRSQIREHVEWLNRHERGFVPGTSLCGYSLADSVSAGGST